MCRTCPVRSVRRRVPGRSGDEPVRARQSPGADDPGSRSTQGGPPAATAGGTRRGATCGGSAVCCRSTSPIPTIAAHIVARGEGCTPCLAYSHPLAEQLGCRLEVKDEGKHYPGFGGNPTLSFKDRGMAMTVAMARSLGLTRLAVPTQGNAGDSLAEYAVAAGIEAVIVMSPDTDLPVLGKVAAYARLYPENVKLEIVPGTIIDCGKRVREHYVPQGYFNVATFQEPGWRTEGKKTLGLEMAEPSGDRLAAGRWQLPDVIVYPTGGGTGVVGMAKAFDELEALGLVGPERPRMICVQCTASTPIVRAFDAGQPTSSRSRPAARSPRA